MRGPGQLTEPEPTNDDMPEILQDWERRVLNAAMTIMEAECVDPHTIGDAGTPRSFVELRDYVRSTYFEAYLSGVLDLTEAARRRTSETLAAAHLQAAKVVTDAPTREEVQALVACLDRLGTELQANDKFHAALGVGNAIRTVLENRLKA